MNILECKNLSYSYTDGDKKRVILKKLNYSFEKGKFYTILGSSGSGKTTLLSILAALDTPESGDVVYKGSSIYEIGMDKYRRDCISIVFQSYNLINYLTGFENVMTAMNTTKNEMPDNKEEVAYNLLKYLGIVKSKADRYVKNLSGGERQRVAIARALSTDVDLIFADEPTGNLDTDTEEEIINTFKKMVDEHNKCVIVVTHSKEVANKSDVVLKLVDGKLEDITKGVVK